MNRKIWFIVLLLLLLLVACQPADNELAGPVDESGGVVTTDAAPADLSPLPAVTQFDPSFNEPLPGEPGGPEDIFADVTFELATTLPEAPAAALVEVHDFPQIDLDTARNLAQQLGFPEPVYVYEQVGAPAGVPPLYAAFDGVRVLTMQGNSLIYDHRGLTPNFDGRIPEEEALQIAEAFLQERGLPGFEHDLRQTEFGDIAVHRIIDGRAAQYPDITIGISADGQVSFLSAQPHRQIAALGSYPLRSAEEAWELLQQNPNKQNLPYDIFGVDSGHVADPNPEFIEQFQSWFMGYEPGQTFHAYMSPQIYRPVTSDGLPRLQVLHDLILAGDAETLEAIAAESGQVLHVWGTVAEGDGEMKELQVEGWEVYQTPESTVHVTGEIRRAGEQVFVDTDEGESYLLPNVPADVPDGLAVNVYGYTVREEGDTRVLDYMSIEKIVDPGDIPPFVDAVDDQLKFTTVTINRVELGYRPVFVQTGDTLGSAPTVYYQPMWLFFSTTDSGVRINFSVPAVDEAYFQ